MLCLQEVDNFEEWWVPQLDAKGYTGVYNKGDAKRHGIAVFYRRSAVAVAEAEEIDLDEAFRRDEQPWACRNNRAQVIKFVLVGAPECAFSLSFCEFCLFFNQQTPGTPLSSPTRTCSGGRGPTTCA